MNTLSIELRPKTLTEVIGNQSVVTAIRNQFARCVPNAWLFSGPSGSGKTSLAQIVAQLSQGKFSGEITVRNINAAVDNGVDMARSWVEDAKYSPISGQPRNVFILDEAQKMTEPAQNALLIPTEGENSNTVWIFCTTEPHKILPTVKRRCQCHALRGLSDVERRKLVNRVGDLSNPGPLCDALQIAEIDSPGLILQAAEKYLAGVSAQEAVQNGEYDKPEYADIARSVLSGNWTKTAEYLRQLKTADARGLRGVVAVFMKNRLRDSSGEQAKLLAKSIKELALYNTFEDGVAAASTEACLFEVCERLNAAK